MCDLSLLSCEAEIPGSKSRPPQIHMSFTSHVHEIHYSLFCQQIMLCLHPRTRHSQTRNSRHQASSVILYHSFNASNVTISSTRYRQMHNKTIVTASDDHRRCPPTLPTLSRRRSVKSAPPPPQPTSMPSIPIPVTLSSLVHSRMPSPSSPARPRSASGLGLSSAASLSTERA